MRILFFRTCTLVFLLGVSIAHTATAAEVIVMIRHAEKPADGLGQINCQGLNRSLKLPDVLLRKYGAPRAIFAPNPGVVKVDHGNAYNYIRPLATIEPTAIRVGLPVNTQWGFEDTEPLKEALLSQDMKDATVFVAWEHRLLARAAKEMVAQLGGNPEEVPEWAGDDYDSIYVITSAENPEGSRTVSFHVDKQGLNHLGTACPGS